MNSVFSLLSSPYAAFNNVYTLIYKDGGTTLEKSCTEPIKPSIKNVIFNNPATVVYWNDGTKTVVKCQKDQL